MQWLIYLFGSGLAFFVGLVLLAAAVGASLFSRGKWLQILVSALALVGMVIIGFSAAPLSLFVYVWGASIAAAWMVLERWQPAWMTTQRQRRLRLAVLATCFGCAVLEGIHHLPARIRTNGREPVYVIGDSLTAGTGEKTTWPELLPTKSQVHNLASVGATAESARKQSDQLPPQGGIVVIEIGGNDVLGSTPPAKFGRDLDQLLSHVAAPERTIVMFELPLPPLANEYGRVQRRLAAKHDVTLIPKRVLMSVLAHGDNTLDTVHLSDAGHKRMAVAVWNIIKPPDE